MKKLKNFIFVALAAAFILGFAASELFMGDKAYSSAERRTLANMPSVNVSSLVSGKYMSDFESFSLDQAPGRDILRSVKAYIAKYLFGIKDNHGVFSYNGYVSQLNYPVKEDKTNITLSKLQQVYKSYIKGTDCKIYLSVIPDKNRFIAEETTIPAIDYAAYTDYVKKNLPFTEYIDIFPLLELSDYYCTDQHWKQTSVTDVAELLCNSMGTEYIGGSYVENTLNAPFFGAYVGQSALSFEADTISYLTSPALDSCIVTSYDTGSAKPSFVYDMVRAEGRDPYEMFLGGSDALITIENPYNESGKKLIIFRDSFASSLVPLMVESYSEITLVDLRYIRPELLGKFVEFENQDVLYLYSTLILNSGA